MTVDDIFVVLWGLIGAVVVLFVWLVFVTVRQNFHAGRDRRRDIRIDRIEQGVTRERAVTQELRSVLHNHVERLNAQMDQQHDLLVDVGQAVSRLVDKLERLREKADGSGSD